MYMYMLGVYNTNCICNEGSSLYVEGSKSSHGEVVTTGSLITGCIITSILYLFMQYMYMYVSSEIIIFILMDLVLNYTRVSMYTCK